MDMMHVRVILILIVGHLVQRFLGFGALTIVVLTKCYNHPILIGRFW